MFILNRLREWNAARKRRDHGWSGDQKNYESIPGFQQNRMLLQDHLFRSRRIGSRKENRRG